MSLLNNILKYVLLFTIMMSTSQVFSHQEDDHDDIPIAQADVKYKEPRYLLYDVNPGEGFNLRRDVYMRIAVLVRSLNEVEPWTLVLPPWSRLYHWRSRDIGPQDRVPWSTFFDLTSLRKFVPVMEFQEFLKISKEPVIEEVYYLQNYAEGWDKWEEKMDKRPCINPVYHLNSDNQRWIGWFFGYSEEVEALKMECLSVMGHAGIMKNFLRTNTSARSVMLDRGETLLHDRYGDSIFWQARRSMRFSEDLRNLGDTFRAEFLDSTDEDDKTVLNDDWKTMKRNPGDALGGPYLGVHLRRADFVRVRQKETPTLKYAAEQIRELATKQNLKKIFIATDAPKSEYEELKDHIGDDFAVYRYDPPKAIREKYKDGGVAIVDQWICAHARYFVGTRESTFSFRIQDEREILGFDPEMTFNRLCTKMDPECEQPTRWRIKY